MKDALAQENNSILQEPQEQASSNSSLRNAINQSLVEPENVNVTSSDSAVNNQTNGTSDNQTMQATSGVNGTGTNGTFAEILNNASQQQQPQASLQSLLNQLPAPPSQLQQQQQLTQRPPIVQPEQPPLPPPQLNLIPPPSSSSAQQALPLITQPLPQQLPSNVLPPPSGPLYPTPSFPIQGSIFQSPTLVSQSSYYDNTGTMHIVGEVINQSPVTARFVKVVATFYNANNQVIGTDFAFTEPADLAPGQRAPFEILAIGGIMPMYQMSYYGLSIDSQQP